MPFYHTDCIQDGTHARDLIIWALYAGFDAKATYEATTPQEKIMAIALHYGDTLAPHKALLKQAYDYLLYAPKHWPTSHAWAVAGRWLEASDLQTTPLRRTLRTTVLLTIAHRIAYAWLHSNNDDEWLHTIDSIITQSWPFMENSFL